MASRKQNPNITGRAMQFRDLSPQGRQGTERIMRQTGDAPGRADAEIERLASHPSRSPKMDTTLASIRLARPGLRKRNVSMSSAASGREALYQQAVESAPHGGDPAGAGWYFHHHGTLQGMAQQHGFDTDRAITASAVMSPNNAPAHELAAANALMDLHRNHTVTITPALHRALGKDAPHQSFIGKTVPVGDLHPNTVAALGATSVRPYVKTTASLETLKDLSLGGTRGNIAKAVQVLRGEVHPDDAINPHSAPKVWSYRNATRMAVPNTPEHVEYMSRVGSHATGNEALDLYGLRHSHAGILDPHAHTAEDTWMNSITSGQQMERLPTGRRGRAAGISPAKTYGSTDRLGMVGSKKDPGTGESVEPDARVGPSAVQHAFNNRATHIAAERASRGTGFRLPAVAMQEVPWTQARINAGADIEHIRSQAAFHNQPMHEEVHGQMDIFGGESRTSDRAVHTKPANVTEMPEGKARVKAEAAASAIHRNTAAKRRREGRSVPTTAKELGNEPFEGWG